MKNILNNSDKYSNFAHYHVPMYPTCYNNNSDESWKNLINARNAWVPVFD